jgi:methyltransferase
MSDPHLIAAAAVAGVLMLMLIESRRSARNERLLRAAGAVEPDDDVITAMTWIYPGSFVAMAAEGMLVAADPGVATLAGVVVFVAAKGLKYWAIASLGPRWTFRVLVPPRAVRVDTGPYAVLRHPNYVAVLGEFVGVALVVGAPLTGTFTTVVFALLIRRRIVVEERALRHPPCT